MSNKPPFDLAKASFFLVAGIMGSYAAILIFTLIACTVQQPIQTCDPSGRIGELLSTLLATAVAFAGGLMRGGNGKGPGHGSG